MNTYVSGVALGVVLYQINDLISDQGVIAFAGKRLQDFKRRYNITEKELLSYLAAKCLEITF